MRLPSVAAVALLAAVALAGCGGGPSEEEPTDTDGDTLFDVTETRGWDITVEELGRRVARHVQSDPTRPDTDGDGIPDQVELQLRLDPSDPDTDGDGLTDCQEVYHSVLADCQAAGADQDRSRVLSMSNDGGLGTDARNADSDPGGSRYIKNHLGYLDINGTRIDVPWGDGIPDGTELAGFDVTVMGEIRRVVTDPRSGDTDRDGLDDGEERFLYGSDPTVADTDGDGCEDGRDIFPAEVESYALGLRSFTLRNESQPAQGTTIELTVLLLDNVLKVPPPGGFRASFGEPVDLHHLDPGPVRPLQCSVPPYDPWLNLQIVAFDTEGGRHLDIGGEEGFVASLWWDPLRAEFAWQPGGPALSKPLALEGRDATLVLEPRAEPQGAQQE